MGAGRRKKRGSFQNYLVKSYLIITIIPICLILVLMFANALKSANQATRQQMESTAELIETQMKALLENMSYTSLSLLSHPEVIPAAKGLNHQRITLLEEQEYYSQLRQIFCSYAVSASSYQVIFFNKTGHYISSGDVNGSFHSSFRLSGEELAQIEWIADVENKHGQSVLLPVQEGAMPLSAGEQLAMVRSVRDPGKTIGYMGVLVDKEYLDGIFSIGSQLGTKALLLGENGQVIYAQKEFPTELSLTAEGSFEEEELRRNYIVARRQNVENNVVLVLVLPKRNLMLKAMENIFPLALEAAALFALTVFFILHYSNRLARPIKDLTRQMQEITIDDLDGSAQKRDDTYRKDQQYTEIAYLYRGYENMRSRLNVMLHNEITSRTLQLQERFASLQAQINPHFLYNTLNVIGIMGMESKNRRIYDACLKLSSLLRYSIADKCGTTAKISEELENIQDYLELMKLRFEHRFTYDILYEETVRSAQVPRLILQPFVENVFEHAYSGEHRVVHLSIRVRREGNGIEFVIEDDGRGMAQEDLNRINREIADCMKAVRMSGKKEGDYGIGMQNTILRLRLYFGNAFSYSIRNGEKGGTHISFCTGKFFGSDQNPGNEEGCRK